MKNNPKILGMLIRKYRLEQNMSQEALCQGICAVSYLSKIEKGTVLCSEEILSKLFDVLGISIPDNSETLEIYEEKLNDYFRCCFFLKLQEAEVIMAELRPKREMLLHSSLVIDMLLAEAYDEYNRRNLEIDLKAYFYDLLQYEEYMDSDQGHRLYLLLGWYETYIANNYIAGLKKYTLAQNRKMDGIVLESLSIVHYMLGNYLESITLGDEAYIRLMDEGYVDRAITLCSVIAASYANFKNIKKMLHYYNRMLSLMQKDIEKIAHVHYNIGSAYLVTGDCVKALFNLDKAYGLLKEDNILSSDDLLLFQKLFLTHMALGERDKAKEYLDLYLDFFNQLPNNPKSSSLEANIRWMEIMYSNEKYLEDEVYLQSIKTLYEASLKDSHHGFHMFYGDYLIEAYKTHRKYKEALKITEALYVKSRFS